MELSEREMRNKRLSTVGTLLKSEVRALKTVEHAQIDFYLRIVRPINSEELVLLIRETRRKS